VPLSCLVNIDTMRFLPNRRVLFVLLTCLLVSSRFVCSQQPHSPTLRVLTQHADRFIEIHRRTSSPNAPPLVSGDSAVVLLTIAQRLGYQLEYFIINQSSPSFLIANLSSFNTPADIAISYITITPSRQALVDFSTSYWELSLSFATSSESSTEAAPSLFAMLNTFDSKLWISVFAFWLLSLLVFLNMEAWSNQDMFAGTRIGVLFRTVYVTLVLFLGSLNFNPRSRLSSLLTLIYVFLAFLLVSTFTAQYSAILLVGNEKSAFDDGIHGVISCRIPVSRIYVLNGGRTHGYFRTQIFPQVQTNCGIAQDVLEEQIKTCRSTRECMENVVDDTSTGFVTDSTVIEYYLSTPRYCSKLKKRGQNFRSENYGIAMRKGLGLKREIDQQLLFLRDTGELRSIQEMSLGDRELCANANLEGPPPLGIGSFWGLTIIVGLLAAVSLACHLFLVIRTWSQESGHEKMKKNNRKRGPNVVQKSWSRLKNQARGWNEISSKAELGMRFVEAESLCAALSEFSGQFENVSVYEIPGPRNTIARESEGFAFELEEYPGLRVNRVTLRLIPNVERREERARGDNPMRMLLKSADENRVVKERFRMTYDQDGVYLGRYYDEESGEERECFELGLGVDSGEFEWWTYRTTAETIGEDVVFDVVRERDDEFEEKHEIVLSRDNRVTIGWHTLNGAPIEISAVAGTVKIVVRRGENGGDRVESMFKINGISGVATPAHGGLGSLSGRMSIGSPRSFSSPRGVGWPM